MADPWREDPRSDRLAPLPEDSAIPFRLLAETLPQIIWTALPGGQVEFYNRRWYEYTGRPPGELDGWTDLVPEEDQVRLQGMDAERSGPLGFEIEYRLRRADGAYRWHVLRGSAHLDAQGKILRWIGTSTDIHDRILTDRERERLLRDVQDAVRARDEFIAIASHDLRTPAMALQLQLDALWRLGQREGLSQRLALRVDRARGQMARLTVLLNNLLDTSRIAAGQLRLEVHEMDLAALADEVIGRFAADLEDAQCVARVHSTGQVVGCWDRVRMDQVLTNLVSNAVKYGAGHPIDVSVAALEGASSAVLHVRDRGIGIPPEQQGQIFERFQRAVEERAYSGSGLGLWIVRQVVEAHGGRVGVESAPGEGATFTVELPLRQPLAGDGA